MAETPVQTVTRLRAKLARRAAAAQRWSEYYDGERPLLFASPEFTNVSGGLFKGFSDNWCKVVTDSTVERLVPMGFRLADGTLDDAAGKAWKSSECEVEVGLAFLESLISGRAFGLVWKPDGINTEITFEHASQAIVEYVPGRRNVRAAGLKVWDDGDHEFATLFLPDTIYRFQRDRAKALIQADGGHNGLISAGGEWVPRTAGLARSEPANLPNPLGVVPLVELANRSRLRGKPSSEIAPVAPLQDAVNTLWAHLLTAADEMALPARVILGMDNPTRDILDSDGEVIGEEDLPIDKFRRDRMLFLAGNSAGNPAIGEFSAASLENYTSVIQVAVQHIAAQTRTPPHYLMGQMVNIGSDAVPSAESGLVSKVTEKQRPYGSALRELMRLEALAAGETARAEALRLGSVVWRDPQYRSESQYADALTKYKAINVPDEALWERIPGVTPDEIERWKTMRDEQAALGPDLSQMFAPKPPDDSEDPADDSFSGNS